MCSAMMIEESQILQILRDHLEESGLTKCMRDFEKHTRTGPAGLPRELLCLRGLALDGQWEPFMAILQSLLDEAWVPRCRYEVLKQQFLENLASYGTDPSTTALHVCSNSKEVMDKAVEQLRELKKLCPCQEEYMTLCHLLSNPSLLTSPHWDIYRARLDCFKLTSSFFTSEQSSPTTSQAASSNKCSCLTRLLVKGWLYEKCERVCAQRCHDCELKPGAVMDLPSWMLWQSDTTFLVTPDAMRLVLAQSKFAGGGRESIASTNKERVGNVKCIDDGIEAKLSEPKMEVPDTSQQQHMGTQPSCAASMKDTAQKQPVHASEAQQSVSNSSLTTLHHRSPSVAQDFGGCSSTPMPSTPPHCTPSSPVSSPVPYIKGTHGLHDTPLHSSAQLQSKRREARSRSGLKAKQLVLAAPEQQQVCSNSVSELLPGSERRHTNSFRATDSDYMEDMHSTALGTTDGISWPSCALLTTVTDPQVIRSVAFSDSGGAVAIGANSKTLRIFHTESLMQRQQQPIELCLLYHHPRYHKGSIYCLAWYGDTVLASGSNDQTIKLLSHSPESETPYSVAGRLDVHAGTVRDMDFMRGGLLVSGGAGSLDLKVSDVARMQLLQSCEGHTDQILGVSAVSEKVVASGSQDHSVRLWDVRQEGGQPAQVLWAQAPVSSVSASAPYIAAALLNGSCCVWDSRNMSVKYALQPHSDECRSVRYSPTGEWILSGSYDGKVCLVSSQGPCWREVCGHSDKVIQCRWHSAGHVFATTGADRRACFWRLTHNN